MAQLIVRVLSDLSQFHTDLQDSEKQIQKFGKGVTDLGGVMSVGLTLPLVGVGIAAASAGTEMNAAMANVATLIPGSTARVLELKDGVQDLAVEVGIDQVMADLRSRGEV